MTTVDHKLSLDFFFLPLPLLSALRCWADKIVSNQSFNFTFSARMGRSPVPPCSMSEISQGNWYHHLNSSIIIVTNRLPFCLFISNSVTIISSFFFFLFELLFHFISHILVCFFTLYFHVNCKENLFSLLCLQCSFLLFPTRWFFFVLFQLSFSSSSLSSP